jgi:hypothetical protein
MDSKDAEKGDDNTDVGSMIDTYVSNADLIPNAGKIVLGMLILERMLVELGQRLRYNSSNIIMTFAFAVIL